MKGLLEKLKAFFSKGDKNPGNEKKAANGKAKKKKQRVPLKQRYREMVSEFRKITWLKPKELGKQTLVVGLFVVALTILVGLMDFGLSNLMRLIAI